MFNPVNIEKSSMTIFNLQGFVVKFGTNLGKGIGEGGASRGSAMYSHDATNKYRNSSGPLEALLFSPSWSVMFESKIPKDQQNSVPYGSNYFYANPIDIPLLVDAFDTARKWLEEDCGIFTRDGTNRIVSIKQISKSIIVNGVPFAVSPVIIEDALNTDVQYEGIRLSTAKMPVFAELTVGEFLAFHTVFKEISQNMVQLTIQLSTWAMIWKVAEVISGNGRK